MQKLNVYVVRRIAVVLSTRNVNEGSIVQFSNCNFHTVFFWKNSGMLIWGEKWIQSKKTYICRFLIFIF